MHRFDDAACRHLDPHLFDPAPTDHANIAKARRVCASCPVRLDCLALALLAPHVQGIWGGLTEAERAAHTYPTRRRTRLGQPL